MGPAVPGALTLVVALLGSAGRSVDTATYSDPATQQLIARAVARRQQQDSSVRDYRARLHYRLSFGLGHRRWDDPLPVAVEEQAAQLVWRLPNDLRVDIEGRRSASRLRGVDLSSRFSRPWFVPRTLGDSIRIFGTDDAPTRAAPHPLAAGAGRFYSYVGGDSVIIAMASRRFVIRSVTVTPKVRDGAFIAGQLWLDTSTGDVVRFTFQFVGTELWNESDSGEDSAAARRASTTVSRILELDADIEYALQDQRYWMPHREVISGRVTLPLGIDFAVPFEASTTFSDYQVNTGLAVVFDAAFPGSSTDGDSGTSRESDQGGGRRAATWDSTHTWRQVTHADSSSDRMGYLAGGGAGHAPGRYQIHIPADDSLRAYTGWRDSLSLNGDTRLRDQLAQRRAALARITERLPREMTGRPGTGLAWEKVADLLRYNRIEGTTISVGEHVAVPVPFTDIYGTLRYGLADHRVMARAAVVRDAPGGRLTVALSRDLQDVDAFATGLSLGNSLRSALSGHDDGAYLLASGLRGEFETAAGARTEVTLSAMLEDERTVTSRARALIPRISGASGYFPPNPAIREGLAVGGGVQLDHTGTGARWALGFDGLAVSRNVGARVTGGVQFPTMLGGHLGARIRLGFAAGARSVPQLALRAGGIHTVRGYDFGVSSGNALWSVQLDAVSATHRPVQPVLFADVGQSGWLREFHSTPLLTGVGIGVSVLNGVVRANLSHPLTNTAGRGFQFGLVFGAKR